MNLDERNRLVDECFKQEDLARRNEYSEVQHDRKAFWHRRRWVWMDKALALLEGRDPRTVLTVLLLGALVLSGCAQGALTAPLPTVEPARAAEVVVIRPSGVRLCGIAVPVMLDGRQVFTLECGKHVRYPVTAGEHIFGAFVADVLFGQHTTTTPLTVVARQRYYLRVDSFVTAGATLTPITSEEGERLMAETSPLR